MNTMSNGQAGDVYDRRNLDWYIDKIMQTLVFIGGISAILFIIGIFVFITMEGMGFIVDRFDPIEFFTSEYWSPSDEDDPEYGILALIAGTASVTGLAMIVAIPFALGAAIYIGEFSTGKTPQLGVPQTGLSLFIPD